MQKRYKDLKQNANIFIKIFSSLKQLTVSRLFWGRSNLYRNLTHIIMISIALLVTFGGVIYRFQNAVSASNRLNGDYVVGSNDLLQQGGSITTVLRNDDNGLSNIKNTTYIVKSGETLADIAKNFKVTVDTIRWANSNLINPFSNEIKTGWELNIPAIDGVLYTVKKSETIDSIISLTSIDNNEANRFNIIEFNQLVEPYTLTEGQKLFIPKGNLIKQGVNVDGIPKGIFINPLSNSSCNGYHYSRGFTSYHDGVDLAKWDGCPVEAAATGTVIYAGWENLSGNCIKINHGGAIVTFYYHLLQIYVKVGQRVQQGDVIAYMGSTGNSTGTHLHFTLKKDNIAVDPHDYLPTGTY